MQSTYVYYKKIQIYFELLYVRAFSSLVKVSKTVFPVWNFVQSLKLSYKNSFYLFIYLFITI